MLTVLFHDLGCGLSGEEREARGEVSREIAPEACGPLGICEGFTKPIARVLSTSEEFASVLSRTHPLGVGMSKSLHDPLVAPGELALLGQLKLVGLMPVGPDQ